MQKLNKIVITFLVIIGLYKTFFTNNINEIVFPCLSQIMLAVKYMMKFVILNTNLILKLL